MRKEAAHGRVASGSEPSRESTDRERGISGSGGGALPRAERCISRVALGSGEPEPRSLVGEWGRAQTGEAPGERASDPECVPSEVPRSSSNAATDDSCGRENRRGKGLSQGANPSN